VVQHLSKAHARELLREALRVARPGDGRVLFEFFGDPSFHNPDPTEDVLSGDDAGGQMYNNAYALPEIRRLAEDCGGELLWTEPWQITKDWANHWAFLRRRAP